MTEDGVKKVDEVAAFELAVKAAALHRERWRPPFSIHLDGGSWLVQSDAEVAFRVEATSGQAELQAGEQPALKPAEALSAARSYCATNALAWKPGFSLAFEGGLWIVGCCQSQFGGQRWLYVDQDGQVVKSTVNPK